MGPMDFTVYSMVPGHVPIIRGVTVPDMGGWGILMWPVLKIEVNSGGARSLLTHAC